MSKLICDYYNSYWSCFIDNSILIFSSLTIWDLISPPLGGGGYYEEVKQL